MKKKLQDMDLHSIQELQCLCARILNTISDFSHVSEHLPPSIEKVARETNEACIKEFDRQYNIATS